MRLFFAVLVPVVISREIVAESKKISAYSLRWVVPENQHFTLRFLGEIEEERVGGLISAGQEIARKHHSFFLDISGAGFFPDERNPRIFWVGTSAGSEKLVALAKDVSSALNENGFPSEDRPFLPHLTVARINVGEGLCLRGIKSATADAVRPLPFQKLELWRGKRFGSFSVNEFFLMESLLLPVWPSRQISPNLARSGRPTGAVYRKIHSFLLAPSP